VIVEKGQTGNGVFFQYQIYREMSFILKILVLLKSLKNVYHIKNFNVIIKKAKKY
jgi:hypothetical protein